MTGLKSKCSHSLIFLVLALFSNTLWAADFVLKDFIDADKRIYNDKPSLLLSAMVGEFIKIKDKWHQVRFFSYETKNNGSHLSFGDFVTKNNLLYLGASISNEALFPTYYFYSGSELKRQGTHFLITTRVVEDKELIAKIEKSNKKSTKNIVKNHEAELKAKTAVETTQSSALSP